MTFRGLAGPADVEGTETKVDQQAAIALSGLTVPSPGGMLLAVAGTHNANATYFYSGDPSGMTEITDASEEIYGPDMGSWYQLNPSQGATGTKTATYSSSSFDQAGQLLWFPASDEGGGIGFYA